MQYFRQNLLFGDSIAIRANSRHLESFIIVTNYRMRHLLASVINYRSVRPCYRFLSLDRIKMSNEVELAKLAAEAQKVIFLYLCARVPFENLPNRPYFWHSYHLGSILNKTPYLFHVLLDPSVGVLFNVEPR